MDQLYTQLKTLYGNKDYSDALIKIVECDNISSTEQDTDEKCIDSCVEARIIKTQSSSTRKRKHDLKKIYIEEQSLTSSFQGNLICSLPVHRNILALQCDYFKKIFSSEMEESHEKEITIKVNQGDGEYMQLFIKSFYDPDTLDDISAYQLLRVLEIADRYCCDAMIEKIIKVLPDISINGIGESENIAHHVAQKIFGLKKVREAVDFLLKKCAYSIINMFYPLEKNMESISKSCGNIPYELLISMLRCEKHLAWHENTILYFVGKWFEFDTSRQTSDNIDLIFKHIDHTDLTPEFILWFMKEKEIIFEKWPKFKEWCNFAVGYHAVSSIKQDSNLKVSKNDNEVKAFKFKMTKREEQKQIQKIYIYIPEENKRVIFKGYKIIPVIALCAVEDDNDYYKIFIHIDIANLKKLIQHTYRDAAIEFSIAVTIYPENMPDHPFSKIARKNCCIISYKYDTVVMKSCYSLGYVHKRLMNSPEKFNLVVAFKDKDGTWPENFPVHLRKEEHKDLNITYTF